jgi:release factor glutamine methyltransferase
VATEVRSLVDEGAARLRRVSDDPRREAEVLLAAALGRTRAWLLAHPEERILDCDATDRYESYVTRRAIGEPIAYILGEKEFWSLALRVTPDVLVPRPETELVVERALVHLPPERDARVLDLATGTGAIALAIAHERPACRVVGTDVAAAAIEVAAANARRLGLANAQFRVGNWYDAAGEETFDLIACNPPYVADGDPQLAWQVRRHEPPQALFSGPTGLESLEVVIDGAPAHLAPGGWLVLEHGTTQGDAVRSMLRAAGFSEVATFRDFAAHERCTEAVNYAAPNDANGHGHDPIRDDARQFHDRTL